MQHLKNAIRTLLALSVAIAALAFSSCSDDFWTVKYKITYDGNGHGTLPFTQMEVESGTVLTSAHLPTLTADDGWTFKGWKDTKLQQVIEEGYTIQSDLNLVAQWTEAAAADDMCTITYVSMIGTEPESKTVEKNTKLTATELPTLTDASGEYEFQGWYNKTDYKRTIISANDVKVTKDIILVAKWNVKGETAGEAGNVAWLSADAGDEKVTLSWTYPSDDFSKVTICVSKKQGAYAANDLVTSKIINYAGNDKDTCTFENLANGTTYWFRVTATDTNNKTSATPIEISATPKAASSTGGNSGSTGSDDSDKGGLIILIQ